MRGLYIFNHDLRLHDNRLLQELSEQVDELICLYILDSRLLHQTRFQTKGLSANRQLFLLQSLNDLSRQLESLGQRLIVKVGDSHKIIPQWVQRYSIERISMTFHPGVYEQNLRDSLLAQGLPLSTATSSEQFTLLTQGLLPFDLDDMSFTFTAFRKQVEPVFNDFYNKKYLSIADQTNERLAPKAVITDNEDNDNLPFDSQALLEKKSDFVGGESRALEQLAYFCQTGRLDRYKETRNGLVGWDFSSKLSPWLANGCLSPRKVWLAVNQFEAEHGENESSYWLKFELLWREYFQWLLLSHGHSYFRFGGLTGKKPLKTFYPAHYKAWVEGNTGHKGVDAAMRQLKTTGWISNRARQWVASCFIHELSMDWRFGAAYFEEQLIDFDVASNWGNWLYLAGVGTDPRGSRQFNLEKQLDIYDPDKQYCQHWLQ